MNYIKNMVVIVFVVCSMLVSQNIYASGPEEKHHKIWDQLNLTLEQKKQLEDNKTKNSETMKAVFEKLKSFRESLKIELMKPQLDMNRINGIQSQLKSLQNEMMDNRLNSILDVRKILTREQFQKFLDIMGKERPWHNKGMKLEHQDKGKDCV